MLLRLPHVCVTRGNCCVSDSMCQCKMSAFAAWQEPFRLQTTPPPPTHPIPATAVATRHMCVGETRKRRLLQTRASDRRLPPKDQLLQGMSGKRSRPRLLQVPDQDVHAFPEVQSRQKCILYILQRKYVLSCVCALLLTGELEPKTQGPASDSPQPTNAKRGLLVGKKGSSVSRQFQKQQRGVCTRVSMIGG